MKNHVWLIYLMFLSTGVSSGSAFAKSTSNMGIFLGSKKADCNESNLKAYDLKSTSPILSPDHLKLKKHSSKPLTLLVEVPDSAVKEINKHLDGSTSHHLLFLKKGELVFTPVVREKLKASNFEWTFSSQDSFDKAVKRLHIND